MAGITRIYCIGGLGGFQGVDGINRMEVQIWQGASSRRWYEAHHFTGGKPLGSLKALIPAGPEDPDALLDACLAFAPDFFTNCEALAGVRDEIGDAEILDFDLEEPPASWSELREEARGRFAELNIFVGDLELMISSMDN